MSRHDCDRADATGLRGFACLERGRSFIFLEASQASSVIIPVIHQTLQVQVGTVASSAPAVPISECLFLSAAFLASSALAGAQAQLPGGPARHKSAKSGGAFQCGGRVREELMEAERFFCPSLVLCSQPQPSRKFSLNQINLCDTTGAQDAAIFKIW